MKKLIIITLALILGSCAKDETNCNIKVYKKKGADWELIQDASFKGEQQYKNYTKTIKNADGTFDVIKTIVECE